MSNRRPLVLLAALALTLLPAGARALDHFKVYQVERIPVNFKVQLSDQLRLPLHDARVETLAMFANPTRKSHGGTSVGIQDANAHHTWYVISQPTVEPRRSREHGRR